VWYFGKSSTFDTNVFYDHDIFCVCFDVISLPGVDIHSETE
jgi:hypothetical protein